MRPWSVAVAGIGILGLVGVARAAGVWGLRDGITSADKEVQAQAERAILHERAQTIDGLLVFVRDRVAREQNPAGLTMAIRVLGKIRATEAVDALVEVLTFREPGSAWGSWGGRTELSPVHVDERPAIAALVEIGNPSLRAVVRAARDSRKGDDLQVACAAAVVLGVLGRRLGVVYVQDALESERNPERRQRLEVLLRITERGV